MKLRNSFRLKYAAASVLAVTVLAAYGVTIHEFSQMAKGSDDWEHILNVGSQWSMIILIGTTLAMYLSVVFGVLSSQKDRNRNRTTLLAGAAALVANAAAVMFSGSFLIDSGLRIWGCILLASALIIGSFGVGERKATYTQNFRRMGLVAAMIVVHVTIIGIVLREVILQAY